MISKLQNKAKEWLLWSQKYTRTDMLYLAKGGSWLTLGRGMSSILAFFSAIAFANLISAETYGTYKYVLSIVGIFTVAALPGLNTAVVRAVAQGKEGTLIQALKTKLRWGLLASLSSLVVAGYYFINDNNTISILFLIAAAFLPLKYAFGIYTAYLEGKKLFSVFTKFQIISQIITAGSIIATLFLTDNLFIILSVYFASATFVGFIFLKITLRKLKPNSIQDPETISYGKHLSFMDVLGIVTGNLDKILIFHFLGAAQVAIYFFAQAPVRQIRDLVHVIDPLAFPKLAERNIADIKKSIYGKMARLFLPVSIITVTYILLAPYLFNIFFPQYSGAVLFSQVYALVLLVAPAAFFMITFSAHAKKKELYIIKTSNPIIGMVLYFILIPAFGIMGAITAVLLRELIKIIISFVMFRKVN